LCDLLQRGVSDFEKTESGGEIDFDIRSGCAGGVGGEEAVCDAKASEPGEDGLSNAAEADEANCAVGRAGGGRRRKLGASEGKWRPVEAGPLRIERGALQSVHERIEGYNMGSNLAILNKRDALAAVTSCEKDQQHSEIRNCVSEDVGRVPRPDAGVLERCLIEMIWIYR
jgi:hypothetical protein